MISASVMASEARARANIYQFLGAVFSTRPTSDSIRGVCEIAAALEIPFPDVFSVNDLDQEYLELFVIPNPRYVAPYESVFRDRWLLPAALKRGSNPGEGSETIKGLLMGESTQKVQQCYLEAGVLPTRELPDHIANELGFMAHLWADEAESSSVADGKLEDLRAKFPREHILKWISQLRERVLESNHRGFYAVALRVIEALLEDDANHYQVPG